MKLADLLKTKRSVPANGRTDGTDEEDDDENAGQDAASQQKAGNQKPVMAMVIAGVLALNGGAFYLAMSGMTPFGGSENDSRARTASHPQGVKVFRPEIENLVIELGPTAEAEHLRSGFAFELTAPDQETVDRALKAYRNALQVYLRSLHESDFQERGAVRKIMEHGRRRIELASPDDVTVREFLVTDLATK